MHDGQRQRVAIAVREQPGLTVGAAAPNWADSMDDVAGCQAIAPGDPRLAGRAAAQRTAFGEKLGTGGAVDGAIDAAAAQQAFVGRVHYGIDVEAGDVAFDDLDAAHIILPVTEFYQ